MIGTVSIERHPPDLRNTFEQRKADFILRFPRVAQLSTGEDYIRSSYHRLRRTVHP